jgi:hypothetical protein
LLNFLFSDITIKLDGETLYGHRFILAARSDKWDPQQLGDAPALDLSGKFGIKKSFCFAIIYFFRYSI